MVILLITLLSFTAPVILLIRILSPDLRIALALIVLTIACLILVAQWIHNGNSFGALKHLGIVAAAGIVSFLLALLFLPSEGASVDATRIQYADCSWMTLDPRECVEVSSHRYTYRIVTRVWGLRLGYQVETPTFVLRTQHTTDLSR